MRQRGQKRRASVRAFIAIRIKINEKSDGRNLNAGTRSEDARTSGNKTN